MRRTVFCLLLCAACTRVSPPKRSETSSRVPPCKLEVSAGLVLDFENTRQAVHDFERQSGSPYAALYIRQVPGRGVQAGSCVRVVQRSATKFMRYTYQAQGVDSAYSSSVGWQVPFAQVTPGHYNAGLCFTGTMDGDYWYLLVKQGTVVTFSLSLESGQYERLTDADRARIAPAFDLVRLMND
jgi:hypothetical protein